MKERVNFREELHHPPMRSSYFVVWFLLIIGFVILAFTLTDGVAGETFYVDDDGGGGGDGSKGQHFNEIQAALDASADGDTILLESGNYTGNYIVNTSVTINSTNGSESTFLYPVIWDEDDILPETKSLPVKRLFFINASNVRIENLTFKRQKWNLELPEESELRGRGQVTFIFLNDSMDIGITNNSFLLTPEPPTERIDRSLIEYSCIFGNGKNLSEVIVTGNSVVGAQIFLLFQDGNNISIEGNHIQGFHYVTMDPTQYRTFGILVAGAGNITIRDNQITDFDIGMMMYGEEYILIEENHFLNCFTDIHWYYVNIPTQSDDGEMLPANAIRNNTFESKEYDPFGNIALNIENSYHFRIENNSFINRSSVSVSECLNFTFNNNHFLNTELFMDEVYPISAINNTINGEEITIIAARSDETISLSNASRVIVTWCNDLVLENITIDDGWVGLQISSSNSIHINGADFSNVTDNAIQIRKSGNINIEQSLFTDCSLGIRAYESDNITIRQCEFYSVGEAISFFDSKEFLIKDCLFEGGEMGIDTYDVAGLKIENCTFSFVDDALKFVATNNVIVKNCSISDIGFSAIEINQGEDVVIQNNTLTSVQTGISVMSSKGTLVSENTVLDFTGHAIEIMAGSDDSKIVRNHLSGNFINGIGIYIWHSSYLNISRNEIADTYTGIHVNGSTFSLLTNNSIRNNSIGVLSSNIILATTFRNNTITGNLYGARSEGSTGTMDMALNDWGDASGPYHPIDNPRGLGDRVTDSITFDPWIGGSIVVLEEDSDDDDSWFPIPFFPFSILSIGLIGLAGASYLREDFRFLLVSLLAAPLYTKLEKDEILGQSNRQEIFSYIVNMPGSNLTKLHMVLPMGYGTLVHHLKVLEREKHIRSRKTSGRKMFFPTGSDWVRRKNGRFDPMDITSDSSDQLTDTKHNGGEGSRGPGDNGKKLPKLESTDATTSRQEVVEGSDNLLSIRLKPQVSMRVGGDPDTMETLSSVPVGIRILDYLERHEQATQKQLVEDLGVKQTTVSYNIRQLLKEGKLTGDSNQRNAVYSLTETKD